MFYIVFWINVIKYGKNIKKPNNELTKLIFRGRIKVFCKVGFCILSFAYFLHLNYNTCYIRNEYIILE